MATKIDEIWTLLRAHTTIESWGMPCITRLASLMGKPVPTTRERKIELISLAKEYIKKEGSLMPADLNHPLGLINQGFRELEEQLGKIVGEPMARLWMKTPRLDIDQLIKDVKEYAKHG